MYSKNRFSFIYFFMRTSAFFTLIHLEWVYLYRAYIFLRSNYYFQIRKSQLFYSFYQDRTWKSTKWLSARTTESNSCIRLPSGRGPWQSIFTSEHEKAAGFRSSIIITTIPQGQPTNNRIMSDHGEAASGVDCATPRPTSSWGFSRMNLAMRIG